jgi:diaminopimelate decarboxylase
MHRHECNTLNFVLTSENQTKDFSYTIFLVKKNKCWKIFKIIRKSLFNYSFYSHPEIGKFQGVTNLPPLNRISSRDSKKEEARRREINKNIAIEVDRRSSSFVDWCETFNLFL